MSQLLKEVLDANRAYAADFGDKANLALPPARHPHLYGRPTGPGKIRGFIGGRCACDP